jgi:L-arabinose isomerase
VKNNYCFWFVTGSQNLYGPSVLEEVHNNSKAIVEHFNNNMQSEYKIICKDTVKTKEEIYKLAKEANYDESCAGIITWMHTFSPSKMWINGLKELNKPVLHLHTQFNKEIPWDKIDMNFMNTNQSAHGDREHGFIHTRMHTGRKVVVGYYENPSVLKEIGKWLRVAVAASLSKHIKVARFGDNMRSVAVTEGDKVEAEIKFGWSVDYFGLGDLVAYVDGVDEDSINKLFKEYQEKYIISKETLDDSEKVDSIRYQLRLEIGIQSFLDEKGYSCYTNTFEDLHGLDQLPGLASQSLMSKGYGFGPEGDWKVAAMTRIMKIMSSNQGTSLMEDYTYHLEDGNETILGAHMLEICPTLAKEKPTIEVHPLGIGGKNPPARMVFDSKTGPAVCASLVDMGGRFRLIILDVEAIELPHKMPNLPVARVLWTPKPNLEVAAKAWIYAGGAHHTVFSYNVDADDLIDFAKMMDIEYIHINENTNIYALEKELMFNDLLWKLK